MRLNLKDFLKSPDQNLNFEGQIENNETEYVIDGLNINFPISYKGVVTKLGYTDLKLDLSIHYEFDTNCDRCLKPMKENVDSTLEAYYFEEMEYESDLQSFQVENEDVYLDDLVMSMVITEIPLKSLCKDDCKGLCPNCGADLNVEECACNNEQLLDPRFEKLLNLFNDEEV